MKILFYYVTPHPMTYPGITKSRSHVSILRSFIRAVQQRHRRLLVTIDDDGHHGRITLASGTVIAHFDID